MGYKCVKCENQICQRCFSKWKVYTDQPTKSKKKKKKDVKRKGVDLPSQNKTLQIYTGTGKIVSGKLEQDGE